MPAPYIIKFKIPFPSNVGQLAKHEMGGGKSCEAKHPPAGGKNCPIPKSLIQRPGPGVGIDHGVSGVGPREVVEMKKTIGDFGL